jgi:hypothetical protein
MKVQVDNVKHKVQNQERMASQLEGINTWVKKGLRKGRNILDVNQQ